MDELDIDRLERLCALMDCVNDERTFEKLYEVLDLFIRKYAMGTK